MNRTSELLARMQPPLTPLTLDMLDDAEATLRFKTSPPVVCLCGSTKFMSMISSLCVELTLRGWIVLPPFIVTTDRDGFESGKIERDVKDRLDTLHMRKIDAADLVLVVNVGQYIGQSTRAEINYAEAAGKPTWFTEGRTPTQEDRTRMAIQDIQNEQWRGRSKYGSGPNDYQHDDAHTIPEWVAMAESHMGRIIETPDNEEARSRFVKAAGLCLSAIESIDRKSGQWRSTKMEYHGPVIDPNWEPESEDA